MIWIMEWSNITISHLGSIPWTVISSCFDSTMSLVNIALKYGMLAAKTIRCALNLLSPACKHNTHVLNTQSY